MRKAFEWYAVVILVTIAIVALLGVLGIFFTKDGDGTMDTAYHEVVDRFAEKVDVSYQGAPRLDTPVIAIADSTLTIAPVENATSYEVYNGTKLLTTTTELTVDLSTHIVGHGSYNVRVRALADGYKPSRYGQKDYVLYPEAGLYQTGTNYTVLLKDWDTLISEGIIGSDGKIVTGQESALAGDLMISNTLTNIVEASYKKCTALTGVAIPDSVTGIGNTAFLGCTSLESIEIPDSVTRIGNYAFNGCTNLTSVTFGENSQLASIGSDAFLDCTSLTSISIPDGVTSIGGAAFRRCTSLTSIDIPYGVTSIGQYTFNRCTNLTSVTIPDSVISIDSNAFNYCTSLASLTFGENSQLASIGGAAFQTCERLTSITIPNGVTTIDRNAFSGCASLASVTFGENSQLASIGEQAFVSTSLTSITIPDSVTSIGERAFFNVDSRLANINFEGTVAQWNAIDLGNDWDRGCPAAEVVCTDGTVSLS